MSSNKIRRSFNPYNVPLDDIREDECKLEFFLPISALRTKPAYPASLLDVTLEFSKLSLELSSASDLVFAFWNIDTGVREASTNVADLKTQKKVYVALLWNTAEMTLFVGKQGGDQNLRKSQGDTKGKVVLGADGELRAIGDKGVYVLDFVERQEGKEIAGSDAAQMWESTVESVNTLMAGFDLSHDYLFKFLLAQQCLVMLVTGFEVYAKERFSEIERFKIKAASTDELLRNFRDRYSDEREKFITNGGTALESILQVPEEQGIINFQNWKKCKLAYNKGYGIVFGDLTVKGAILRHLPDYFRYRHKIIHSKHISPWLNSDKPNEEPVYIYSEQVKKGELQFIEKARNDFDEFISALHEATKRLS